VKPNESHPGGTRIRRHLNYANVTATLALVLAIASGAAYAVDKIHSRDIANNSVRSADLKNRKGVKAKDVKPDSLTGRDINEHTLSAGPIARIAGNQTGPCALEVTSRTCVATAIFPARPSHLLVVVTGNQESINGPGKASCRIAIDGVEETLAVHPGEANIDNTDVTGTNGFARTFMPADAVAEGKHNVALSCKLLNGQVRINEPTIAAIAIAAG
jgi:septal ring-binding cell division protein DamX